MTRQAIAKYSLLTEAELVVAEPGERLRGDGPSLLRTLTGRKSLRENFSVLRRPRLSLCLYSSATGAILAP